VAFDSCPSCRCGIAASTCFGFASEANMLSTVDLEQPGELAARIDSNVWPNNARWPTANLAIGWPIWVTCSDSFIATQAFVMNGDAVAGNLDLGVYDLAGNRLASTGSTAQAGVNTLQIVNLSASVSLAAGTYYLFQASDTSAGTQHWKVNNWGNTDPNRDMIYGQVCVTASFPLPATLMFGTVAAGQSWYPLAGLAKAGALL
jgi:hypothetical protein